MIRGTLCKTDTGEHSFTFKIGKNTYPASLSFKSRALARKYMVLTVNALRD